MAMIYVIVALPVLVGFASLAVDLGNVQTAKTALRAAADAAAINGCEGIAGGTAVTMAIQAAADNKINGVSLVLQTSDVTLGKWANGAFTAGGTPTNAVKVSAQCSAARGTAIPLTFARAIGQSTCNITATSIAYMPASASGYGFFATGQVLLQNGPILFDSYNAATSNYSGGTAQSTATVASNSSILTNNVTVDGSLQAGPGQSISHQNGTFTVTGSTTSLSSTQSYPAPTLPGSYTSLNNVTVNSGSTYTLGTAGQTTTYYATNFKISSGATLNVNGPVIFYINGNFEIDGTMNVLNNLPANFTVEDLSSAGVTFNGTSNIYAHVYAPNSAYNSNNAFNFFGTMVVGQFNVSGQAKFHDDESNSSSSSTTGPLLVN